MKLFVYGTLKRGYALNMYLKSSKFLGNDIVKGFDIYSNGGFPYIVHGEDEVKGEVYELDPKALRVLDLIEGGYNREIVKGNTFGDMHAYVYYGDTDNLIKLNGEF